jgi:hypothetical protein
MKLSRRDALKVFFGAVAGTVVVTAPTKATPLPALTNPRYVPPGVYLGHCPPTEDMKYIAMLEDLERQGIPIPIRVWTDAGGYDLDALINNIKQST